MELKQVYEIAKSTHSFSEFASIVNQIISFEPTTIVSSNEYELKLKKQSKTFDL